MRKYYIGLLIVLVGCTTAKLTMPPMPVASKLVAKAPLATTAAKPVEFYLHFNFPKNATNFVFWYLQSTTDLKTWTNEAQFYGKIIPGGTNTYDVKLTPGNKFYRMLGTNRF